MRRYGVCNYNPRGNPVDPKRCEASIWDEHAWTDRQCSFRHKHERTIEDERVRLCGAHTRQFDNGKRVRIPRDEDKA